MRSPVYRLFVEPIEALLAAAVFSGFALLPVDAASALGGWLFRLIGPWLPVSAVARGNLAAVFPEKAAAERETILRGSWENMGRVMGEFPHLGGIVATDRVEVVGAENVRAMGSDGKAGIFISGHLGNWEISGFIAAREGVPLHLVYRSPNNPWVEWLYRRGRLIEGGGLIPKGSSGARQLVEVLRKGGHLGMLVDQKMNDGIEVPFLGRPAMTAPAVAQFALRFGCPVVPARVERLKGVRFRVTVLPPMETPSTGDRHADMKAMMTAVNDLLGGWIRERPDQWMWMHRRWPKPSPNPASPAPRG